MPDKKEEKEKSSLTSTMRRGTLNLVPNSFRGKMRDLWESPRRCEERKRVTCNLIRSTKGKGALCGFAVLGKKERNGQKAWRRVNVEEEIWIRWSSVRKRKENRRISILPKLKLRKRTGGGRQFRKTAEKGGEEKGRHNSYLLQAGEGEGGSHQIVPW